MCFGSLFLSDTLNKTKLKQTTPERKWIVSKLSTNKKIYIKLKKENGKENSMERK